MNKEQEQESKALNKELLENGISPKKLDKVYGLVKKLGEAINEVSHGDVFLVASITSAACAHLIDGTSKNAKGALLITEMVLHTMNIQYQKKAIEEDEE